MCGPSNDLLWGFLALVILGGALLAYLDGFFSVKGATRRALLRQYRTRMRWGDYDDARKILDELNKNR